MFLEIIRNLPDTEIFVELINAVVSTNKFASCYSKWRCKLSDGGEDTCGT